nr:sugar transferase [Acidimicrobiia bacterium]
MGRPCRATGAHEWEACMTSAEAPRAFGVDALRDEIASTTPTVDTVVDLTGDDVVIDITSAVRPAEPDLYVVPRNKGLLAATPFQLAVKRAIDIIGATIALVLLSPVFLVVAIAVKLSSPGPVLFKQTRIGKYGEPFTFLKFRSMRVGADNEKRNLIDLNEVDGPVFKIREDPRITSVGRFLRKTSLDELPQLLHVLSGRMSLVGVRPPVPEEVAEYSAYERQRLLIKPGLTCIWQVSGRSDLDFRTWMRMDLEYIENWSLALDLKLILKTFSAVLSGRGAY